MQKTNACILMFVDNLCDYFVKVKEGDIKTGGKYDFIRKIILIEK